MLQVQDHHCTPVTSVHRAGDVKTVLRYGKCNVMEQTLEKRITSPMGHLLKRGGKGTIKLQRMRGGELLL